MLLVTAFALATPSIKSVNVAREETTLTRLMHQSPPRHIINQPRARRTNE
jgi:hypothetical protein